MRAQNLNLWTMKKSKYGKIEECIRYTRVFLRTSTGVPDGSPTCHVIDELGNNSTFFPEKKFYEMACKSVLFTQI